MCNGIKGWIYSLVTIYIPYDRAELCGNKAKRGSRIKDSAISLAKENLGLIAWKNNFLLADAFLFPFNECSLPFDADAVLIPFLSY
jgi:hypothetical protein